jgi:hypothetical protein
MTVNEYKYDVAISFLVQDLKLASALNQKLSVGLNVFFFPHGQEELAGTDGLESMRAVFRSQSRLNVVVYREDWGNTPWTGVEEAAIKDSCLENYFRNLFFFVVQPTGVYPSWLPDTHIRFNYGEFTLEDAAGAIKARVHERGGHYRPLTPIRKAELLKAEQEFQQDRSDMSSSDGIKAILAEVKKVVGALEKEVVNVNAHGDLEVECEASDSTCVLRSDNVGMILRWDQRFDRSLEGSALSVEEYTGRLRFNRDQERYISFARPECIKREAYKPELSRAREYGWVLNSNEEEYVSSASIADKCLLQLMNLIERERAGSLENRNHR